MAPPELVQRARSLLTELARAPRFAGSSEESAARQLCKSELERAGFECRELPFEYSEWPGRWGPPIAAAFQAFTVLTVAHMAVHHGALSALAVGAILLVALMFASTDVKRRWIARLPLQRARSTNLEARRGDPRVWLVAHLDSKSQTVAILVRIASSVVLATAMVLSVIVLLLSIVSVSFPVMTWHAIALVAVLGALPSMFCFVQNRSNGAVDNASGVVAALLASQSDAAPRDLGVVITSGEELGLAGARAWALSALPFSGEPLSSKTEISILNCDTVDEAGQWRCMYTGTRPDRITAAAETIAAALGVRLRIGRLIPGILADSMVFADRGLKAVTVARGTLKTLARIHTRRDNSNTLTGNGVAEASAILSALAKELA
ncbi:MAG TPA: M28 family peptidase [Gemmatimonadaceae bacterium]|nr:M28 family peptidase [Gemmatimonadaceae bacterium]